MKLSFVVPCFNEGENIIPFAKRVREVFFGEDYEIVFVNDGSKDNTLSEIRKVSGEEYEKVKLINFSKNFGKEAAMYAGLQNAEGDYVAVIDADLQQDPEYVKTMAEILDTDKTVDAVCAYQAERKENQIVAFLKKGFYRLSNHISDVKMEENASDFRLLRRKVVDAILSLNEYHRFSKGIFSFVGFNTKYIPYQVKERNAGQSKWSVSSLFRYAFSGIFAFSVKPLKLPSLFGVLCLLTSIFMLIAFSFSGFSIERIILVCLFFLASVILFSLRIMGEYIALSYIEGKKRPVFIIDKIEQNF